MNDEEIHLKSVRKQFQKIVFLPISRVWNGYGSYIFLELGGLRTDIYYRSAQEIKTSLIGDWTLEISGKWFLYTKSEQVYDYRWQDYELMTAALRHVTGLTIQGLRFDSRLNGLQVYLENNLRFEILSSERGFVKLVYNNRRWLVIEQQRAFFRG